MNKIDSVKRTFRRILKFPILELKRFATIFLISTVLSGFALILGFLILGFNINQIYIFDVIIDALKIAIIISVFHFFLCLDSTFFRKFGILLPNDITYYIFVFNKSSKKLESDDYKIMENKLIIKTPETSKHILSYPEFEEGCLHCDMGEFSAWETKHFFLLLHTVNKRKDRKIDFNKDMLNKNLQLHWWSPDHISNEWSHLERFFLLISRNFVVILCISMILILLFGIVLLFNPPINLIVDPMLIKANLTEGEEKLIEISIKNIGCDLRNITIEPSDSKLKLDDNWKSDRGIYLSSGDSEGAKITIKNMSEGECSGILTIKANGVRDLKRIESINKTELKSIYEIPFNLQIKTNNSSRFQYDSKYPPANKSREMHLI
jgi:hypothetical protein